MYNINNTLGDRIKTARTIKGYTQCLAKEKINQNNQK